MGNVFSKPKVPGLDITRGNWIFGEGGDQAWSTMPSWNNPTAVKTRAARGANPNASTREGERPPVWSQTGWTKGGKYGLGEGSSRYTYTNPLDAPAGTSPLRLNYQWYTYYNTMNNVPREEWLSYEEYVGEWVRAIQAGRHPNPGGRGGGGRTPEEELGLQQMPYWGGYGLVNQRY